MKSVINQNKILGKRIVSAKGSILQYDQFGASSRLHAIWCLSRDSSLTICFLARFQAVVKVIKPKPAFNTTIPNKIISPVLNYN